MSATLLDGVIELAEKIDTSPKESLLERRDFITKRIDSLNSKKQNLLAIERAAIDQILADVKAFVEERVAVNRSLAHIEFAEKHGFPKIDPIVFSWETEEGLPSIVPFPIDSPNVWISIGEFGNCYAQPEKTRFAVGNYWNNIYKSLVEEHGRPGARREYRWETRFSGVIPDSIREKISAWRSSHHLYILAEVDEWKMQEIVIPQVDPILCVQHEKALWVIDKFDTTPVEDYLLDEFTT